MAGIPGAGGKKGRSGRKTKAVELGLPALLEECWSMESRRAVIRKLGDLAKQGNEKAASLLLAYTYGKPHETITAKITLREYEVEIGGSSTERT